MDLEPSINFADLQPNFLNLSLLICHLFVGGNFRMAHILYHPEAFDDRILKIIDSACPLEMPKTSTDITSPGNVSVNQSQQPDRDLQLIFLPQHQLAANMDHIKASLSFFRVFVFSSTKNAQLEHENLINDAEVLTNRNSSSLMLVHNKTNGAIDSYIMMKTSKTSMERVDLLNSELNTETKIFESALGDRAFGRYIGVYFMDLLNCNSGKQFYARQIIKNLRSFSRLYYFRLNMSFADSLIFQCKKSKSTKYLKTLQHHARPIYSELSSDSGIVPTDFREMKNENSIELHFYAPPRYDIKKKTIYAINSYKWLKIRIIFVYGADFTRQFDRFNVFQLWRDIYFWILSSLLVLSATVLYILRRLAGIRSVDFVVCFLEVFSLVFGGGNIPYQNNKSEEMFFGIGLFASLFLVSIYMADFSAHRLLYQGAQKVDSIDEVAERNITFALAGTLIGHKANIAEMLSDTLKRDIALTLNIDTAVRKMNDSFACIVSDDDILFYTKLLITWKKDFDIIPQHLGVLNKKLFLKSDFHVPEQSIAKFNHLTTEFMENGLLDFIDRIESFKFQIQNRFEIDRQETPFGFEPITINEFYYSFILYMCHLAGIALIISLQMIWTRIQVQGIRLKEVQW